jgi:hypothetical protein
LGALKSKSRSGALSLVVFLLCALSFFVYVAAALSSTVGDYVRHSYGSFQTLNAESIKRLIAFAYTYHYLKWFSKTSVIKWHEISKAGLR